MVLVVGCLSTRHISTPSKPIGAHSSPANVGECMHIDGSSSYVVTHALSSAYQASRSTIQK
uniref:Uncharacterized protein n=1 Tax=Arion vulgaris TaxID=1028688 RepID=A0A0B7BKZ3_9EUPU